MSSTIDLLFIVYSGLVILSILTIKLSNRLGIPSLVLFLGIGMLAGSDGLGGIYFDNPAMVQTLGVIALVLILFSGGLDTEWRWVRPILWDGLALSTIGVLLTAVLVGAFVSWVHEFSFLEGLLLGAIVSSTDAAAVFMVLKARNAKLPGSLPHLLEFESGSNDPMAVVLTLAIIQLLTNPATSVSELALFFTMQMAVGSVIGIVMGEVIRRVLNTLELELEGIYPVLSVALALLTYGLTAIMHGSGFLAVYLAGLVLRRKPFTYQPRIVRFHDELAWMMQITMFLILGLQVFPSRLVPIAWVGLLMSLYLIVIARPVSVYVALALSRLDFRQKTLVAWVGLRGAVPIVLATFPLLAGVKQADSIFDLVFFIAVTSVLLQGPPIPLITRLLNIRPASADLSK
ncbi:Potassium/proton antiporter [Nitrospira sp. KM1]|uniref:potassium/proton antiporter n=1 Tax=Nitrospira sp. KM1 TaxID=1936990 RepID=UPI0013A737A2|nr:potassium/proton antiporter [Nitrospira sp. KM1]BCA53843.1 Potassium/proton antiporter [Nitrospira sp. KM1]